MEAITVKSVVHYQERIRQRTRRVIDCIPPDKIEWTCHEGRFSFGDMIRHIAVIERYMYAEAVIGNASKYRSHGRELADGYEEVVAFMDELHEESRNIFSSLSDDDLFKKCRTPAGSELSVWKWMRAMTEHEIHHRGQLYLMLGLIGAEVPPLFGLTSEEARKMSKVSEQEE